MQVSLLVIGAGISFIASFRKANRSFAILRKIPRSEPGVIDIQHVKKEVACKEQARPLIESAYSLMMLAAILLFIQIFLIAISKGGAP
ncbi:hypothetical protein A3C91_03080 [Candidatus Azambacteria bacterium RIFCSPHIGHO2_02_FULL_52_12]|uniref:Uncharacterized protein n=1 Tax=Candidatus Azambacteria bacterium RIFCSPLOWO2_01_FULL_46_25 TaxID=1797298 RepID=A0A1F5BT64_9BACT|nr:MAG: hypothetical protein A3C91_03080 [Candidatus Azambacteria bacterium RIFCSPHIGHO2_02_FULL_52_12]OGD33816.1 MAG: hypothetical protein A2988_01945 [Candidatus Azambacteria bacterium RIFCSPLOWO2_01_FULL_46_25]OGD37569.1 MAG: hypothetical protein A2850_04020 [Candidatus Azambacteria bacterium RIFCSPHIGHO2_01_FULL_51_74]